eukprot:3962590-Alexandrium_andersonii.AAC.1
MHATLRQGVAAPLTALRDEAGVLTFEPLEVDRLARAAWAGVYASHVGPCGDAGMALTWFAATTGAADTQEPFPLPEVSRERLGR